MREHDTLGKSGPPDRSPDIVLEQKSEDLTGNSMQFTTVRALDHVNIRTRDVQGTLRFFADVLGLTPGAAPGMNPIEFGWLFSRSGAAIFHVQLDKAESLPAAPHIAHGTGPIDHIALDCANHEETVCRLRSLGIAYRQNEVISIQLKQVFLHDPNGILIELNFRQGDH